MRSSPFCAGLSIRAAFDRREYGDSRNDAGRLFAKPASKRAAGFSIKEHTMAKARHAVPEGHHTVTPQLVLDNAAQAIDWYKKALGAAELSRAVGPDGRIMHAEIRVGDSPIMLHDVMGTAKSPKALGGSPASLWVYVADCDALFNRAVAAGAEVRPGPMGQLMDQFWGDRSGTFTDPYGYQWTIATHTEDLTPEEMKQRADEFMKSFTAPA
jgi:PhnB protein